MINFHNHQYTCSVFFVHFLHNHNVLLINPGFLCEEMDLCSGQQIFEKDVLKS